MDAPHADAWQRVQAIAFADLGSGEELYIGGDFHLAGNELAHHLARWDGEGWNALARGQGMLGAVYAFESFDDGNGAKVYAAGRFQMAGSTFTNGIARWNGTSWEALPGNPFAGTTSFWTLKTFDDGSGEALYVGGTWGTTGSGIARFDETTWTDVGGGIPGAVNVLEVWDDGSGPALYAGGPFTTAGAATVNHVARWDELAWSPLGSGVSHPSGASVEALAVHDDGNGPDLYVGGNFDTAGGAPADYVARWDGVGWSKVGNGFDDTVYALISVRLGFGSQNLIAGGSFTYTSAGAQRLATARWNGNRWRRLTGSRGTIAAFALFDDGEGERLYAAGPGRLGQSPSYNLLRLYGTDWVSQQHEGGLLFALGSFGEDPAVPTLWIGGSHDTAGPVGSSGVSRLVRPRRPLQLEDELPVTLSGE